MDTQNAVVEALAAMTVEEAAPSTSSAPVVAGAPLSSEAITKGLGLKDGFGLPPVRRQVGERVTFYSPKRHLVVRFPFRVPEYHKVANLDGGVPRLICQEPVRDCARFVPQGKFGVIYVTDDREEIQYLEGRMDDRSPKFDSSLQIWKREPIFEEVE